MARLRNILITAFLRATFVNMATASEQKPLMATERTSPSPAKSPFTDDFGDFVQKQLERWHTPGVSIAVIDGDDVYSQVRTNI